MEWIGEPLVRYGVVTGGEEERRWERVVRRLERAWLGRVDRMRVRAVRVCRAVAAEVQSAQLRAQLTQWVLEWLVIVGEAEQRDVGEWPPDDRLRARQLLVCMNAGFTPPWEAWGWLAGASKVLGGRKPPGAGSAAWEGVWREFCALARDECAGAELGVLREQPLCWLAGTPLAEIRRGILVNWNHAAVRAYFRAAWERARRSGRETVSALEEEWWERVRKAFPRLRVERHVRLPGTRLHLDVYWPGRGVALEVQGEPHWRAIERFGGGAALARRQEHDARKRGLCRALGITLVEVTPDSSWEVVETRLRALLRVRTRKTGETGSPSA